MPSAAIVVIGNEILSGKFPDENAPWLVRRFRELGVDLHRIVTIPDVPATIAREVRHASEEHDHVVTSGGVGPTHDDVTYAGIAEALGVPLVRNAELEGLLHARMGPRVNEAALRMCDLPDGAELLRGDGLHWPVVLARNVLVLPGVPSMFRTRFDAVAGRYTGSPVQSERLVTHASETQIAEALSRAAERWPQVAIGSYPRFEVEPHVVLVTLESRDAAALADCHAWLADRVPAVG
jgi:molybdenum cofactor synthesis domain-containing protein